MKSNRRYLANFDAQSLALIAACTFGGASTLHAQQTPATAPPATTAPAATGAGASAEDSAAAFKRVDANNDGKISRAEAQASPAMAQRFDQIDADADGMITRAEYDKAMKM